MKLLVGGDPHGNIDLINKYVQDEEAKGNDIKAVLVAGDMGMFYENDGTPMPKNHQEKGNFYEYLNGTKSFNVPVFTVAGNHDNYDLVSELWPKADNKQPDLQVPNLYVLMNGEIAMSALYNENMELKESIKIGALGGIYSPIKFENDFNNGSNRKFFTRNQYNKLLEGECDILLMHDLVSGERSKGRVYFSDEMWKIFHTLKPKYTIVGHFHWTSFFRLNLDINTQMAFIMLPMLQSGYLVLDTETWDAVGTRFDKYEIN